jgi:hypothetical protein
MSALPRKRTFRGAIGISGLVEFGKARVAILNAQFMASARRSGASIRPHRKGVIRWITLHASRRCGTVRSRKRASSYLSSSGTSSARQRLNSCRSTRFEVWLEMLGSLLRGKSELLTHLLFGFQHAHFAQRCPFQEREHQSLIVWNGYLRSPPTLLVSASTSGLRHSELH